MVEGLGFREESPGSGAIYLVAEFIGPQKVYTFSSRWDSSIPKSVKCTHSATEYRKEMSPACSESQRKHWHHGASDKLRPSFSPLDLQLQRYAQPS